MTIPQTPEPFKGQKSLPKLFRDPATVTMPPSPSSSSPTARGPPVPLTAASAFSRLQRPKCVGKQLQEASLVNLADLPTIHDLPKIIWRQRRFVLQDWIAKKHHRSRTSWIKDYGYFLLELSAQDTERAPVWCCRLCDDRGVPEFFVCKSTTSAADHLNSSVAFYYNLIFTNLSSRHRITRNTSTEPDDENPTVADLQRATASKRPHPDSPLIPQARKRRARTELVALFAARDLPLSLIDDSHFRSLLRLFDAQLAELTLCGRTTLKDEVKASYLHYRGLVKQALDSSLTSIHLSFDLWTSPSRQAVMAINAHYIDNQKNHQTRLLGLRQQPGAHSGPNMAATVTEVVTEWGLVNRIGTVVCDNAASNDTCLLAFYTGLDPTMRPIDVSARRIRCYGHILNLVARAFLYGDDDSNFERQSAINLLLGADEADISHWRQRGPIGKLHNIVRFIRSSPQRTAHFKRISITLQSDDNLLTDEPMDDLEVIQNNQTRWNSTYLMIQRALVKQHHINAYIAELEQNPDRNKRIPTEDHLTFNDWHMLAEIMQILEPIYRQTMRTQGQGKADANGRLWEVMTGMEYLLELLEDWRNFYDDEATGIAAETALNVGAEPTSPSETQLATSQESELTTRVGDRPVRSRHPPAYLTDYEADLPARAGRAGRGHRQQHLHDCQPTRRLFDEAALPEHTGVAYTTSPRQSAAQLSMRDRLTVLHRCYIREALDKSWAKLNTYYTKLSESPLFAAAVILHPGLGLAYLEANWDQRQWIQDAKDGLRGYLDRWYRPQDQDGQQPAEQVRQHRQPEADPFSQWIASKKPRHDTVGDELQRYYGLGIQQVDDVIQWWLDHRRMFPYLCQLALDIWAIPAMASECERTFSSAKLLLTTLRNNMDVSLAEQLQCIKQWLRHVVPGLDIGLGRQTANGGS
jgi:hypothetical protein